MAATKKTRVRILRHVQGEAEPGQEVPTLAKGSVVDVSETFAAELIGSRAAESAEGEKTVTAPLHPEDATKAAAK